jgi:hypothetical protein
MNSHCVGLCVIQLVWLLDYAMQADPGVQALRELLQRLALNAVPWLQGVMSERARGLDVRVRACVRA